MEELKIIAHAKNYIDKLAKGINPLTDEPVSDDDIVNNVRISRCLFCVSDVLDEVIRNGGINKSDSKIPFSITPEQLEKYEYPLYPLGIMEFLRNLLALTENPAMKPLPANKVNDWLVEKGFLTVLTYNDKKKKIPTDDGIKLGIISEKREGIHGEYTAILYDKNVQQFIIDNIFEIIDFCNK